MKAIDLVGMRFGKLTAFQFLKSENGRRLWLVVCDCGKGRTASTDGLRSGRSSSCGCDTGEAISRGKIRHGHAPSSSTTPTYRSWSNMVTRCTRSGASNYRFYGGRGISVCDRWLGFEAFLSDMGERPTGTTIDRIDPNGNYEPGNCRWASLETQHTNRRNTRLVRARGEARTVRQWAEILAVSQKTIWNRIHTGWTDEEAIEGRRVGR